MSVRDRKVGNNIFYVVNPFSKAPGRIPKIISMIG
jgi:hypothetical protein